MHTHTHTCLYFPRVYRTCKRVIFTFTDLQPDFGHFGTTCVGSRDAAFARAHRASEFAKSTHVTYFRTPTRSRTSTGLTPFPGATTDAYRLGSCIRCWVYNLVVIRVGVYNTLPLGRLGLLQLWEWRNPRLRGRRGLGVARRWRDRHFPGRGTRVAEDTAPTPTLSTKEAKAVGMLRPAVGPHVCMLKRALERRAHPRLGCFAMPQLQVEAQSCLVLGQAKGQRPTAPHRSRVAFGP